MSWTGYGGQACAPAGRRSGTPASLRPLQTCPAAATAARGRPRRACAGCHRQGGRRPDGHARRCEPDRRNGPTIELTALAAKSRQSADPRRLCRPRRASTAAATQEMPDSSQERSAGTSRRPNEKPGTPLAFRASRGGSDEEWWKPARIVRAGPANSLSDASDARRPGPARRPRAAPRR